MGGSDFDCSDTCMNLYLIFLYYITIQLLPTFLYQMHKNGDRCIGKIAEQNDSRSYKTIGHGTSKGCMRLQLRQYTHGPHQEYILHSTNSICVFAHFITTIKVY